MKFYGGAENEELIKFGGDLDNTRWVNEQKTP